MRRPAITFGLTASTSLPPISSKCRTRSSPALANQLGAELISVEAGRAERAPNPDSMDLYFQGLASLNRGVNPANMAQARGFFERAVALDPNNLDALLGVGRVDYTIGGAFLSDDRDARLAAAEGAIAKVLSKRPNDALAHEIMGGILNQTSRSDQGIAELERALALDPNLAIAHGDIGLAKLIVGRPQETEAHEKEALRLSPRDPFFLALAASHRRREDDSWAPMKRQSHCFAAPSRSTGPPR